MQRCAPTSRRRTLTLLLQAGLAPSLVLLSSGTASAQVSRLFPGNAYRGEIQLINTSEALLNGVPVRLAPGVRIRDMNNMLVVSGAVLAQKLVVHYTIDILGLVKDVWILREDELARRPWPRNAQEASLWQFDFASQTWTKP